VKVKLLSISEFKAYCTEEIPALGSGKGSVTYGPNYDPAASAWDSNDWKS